MIRMTAKGKVASGVEYFFGVFFILGGVGLVVTRPVAAVGSILLGVFFIICGYQWTQLRALCKRYGTLLSADSDNSIDRLASAVNSTPAVVRSNIEMMIKKGLVQNVAIDEQSLCIVVADAHHSMIDAIGRMAGNGAGATSAQDVLETIVVQCKGCGASNSVIKGRSCECEHCGSPLTA